MVCALEVMMESFSPTSAFINDRLGSPTGGFFRINPSDNSLELLHTFSSNCPYNFLTNQSNYSSFGNDFLSPGLGIVEAEPGVFYGIAIKGGDHDQGGIWKFDINGSVEKRIPNNLNIAIKGKVAEQLFNFMPQIALSSGSACTSGTIERSHVLSAMKLNENRIDGSFRISAGRNTTKEEIIDLIESIKKNV